MAFPNEQAILTNIANAIRAKDGTTAPMKASVFSTRIRMIPDPSAPPLGEHDRKMVRMPAPLSWAQEDAQHLIRCDGEAAYAGRSQEIYDTFKSGEWIREISELRTYGSPPAATPIPARAWDSPYLAGNKIYVGSTSAATSILVIDTLTGRVKLIEGLPSRVYNTFQAAGNRVYCLHTWTIPTTNIVVWIDMTTDTAHELTISTASRAYNGGRLIGNRFYFSCNTAATEIVYVDTDTNTVGVITGLVSRAHNLMFVAGTKLYVATNAAATSILSITGITATVVQTLPSRTYNVWYLTGNFLFVSTTGAATSIVRINITNDTFVDIGATGTALPNRAYTTFVMSGTKLYCGSSTAYDSIVVINNVTGVFLREIGPLVSRSYSVFFLLGGAGGKLYTAGYSSTVLVVIDTDMDTWSEVTVHFSARQHTHFYLNGTRLFVFSGQSVNITNLSTIDTTTDTYILIDLFVSNNARSQSSYLIEPKHNICYIGSATSERPFMQSVNLATNTRMPDITGIPRGAFPDWAGVFPPRQNAMLILANNKIFVFGSTVTVNTIVVLTESVLPRHVLPIYIYGE